MMTLENWTKEKLIDELRLCHKRIEELEKAGSTHVHSEEKLRKLSHDLGERVKELNCLLAISRLRDKPFISFDKMLQQIIELIPSAWQYPEITCARLRLPDKEFKTDNFKETLWRQESKIYVNHFNLATLEVYYLEERKNMDEGPFLKEERNLLDAIAERIQKVIILDQSENQKRIQEQKLIQLDKIAALGTLVLGVAHEINNPNNSILLNAITLSEAWESMMPIIDRHYDENPDLILGGIPYCEIRDNILLLFEGILDGSKRIKNIVESLKDFSRPETPGMVQSIDINKVIRSSLILLENLIRNSTKSFSVKYGDGIPELSGNFQRLEQVIINLIQNSCEALPNNDKGIFVSTSYQAGTKNIVVTIRDEGTGIAPENLPFIQDPFFTTKRNSGGTGLGLSVSAGIVKAHEGTLEFSSTLQMGTTVTLTLPVLDNNGSAEVIR